MDFRRPLLTLYPALLMTVLLSANSALAADPPAEEEGGIEEIGEYTCEADVYYIWKRREDSTQGAQAPQAVFHVRVGERGAVELDVKNKLLTRLSGVEAEAVRTCQQEHHNISACVATRLKTFSGEYHQMDFNARRVLLDTITEDCANSSGTCMAAHTGPITCLFERPPGLVVPEQAEADPKAKAKKK